MIGRLLGGRYAIFEKIDSGGMADIYKAVCKKTQGTVAVKVLKEEFAQNEEYVSRFKKEAEAAFSIEHPGIVHVTDIGCDNGAYYMVMEFVEGRTLKAITDEQGRLGEKEAVGYAVQVCDALEAAHCEGIIHRDIKPQNILVNGLGQVKITDFGIAASASSAENQDNQVMGSVHYISPEQVRGEKASARTDIYSLGIVLYEMLTGCLPHTGEKTVAVALKHINEKLTPPHEQNSGISRAVSDVVVKATRKSPKDRYRSAAALKADLLRALREPDGDFVGIPRKTLSDGARAHASGKHKVWKICVLVALLVIAAGAIFLGVSLLGSPALDNVQVGGVTGLPEDDAIALLEESGLLVDVVYESSETIGEGVVIAQSVAEGAQVAKGTAVVLTVSSGPAGLVMPDFAGRSVDEAQASLQAMGLAPADVTYEPIDSVPAGIVLSQMPEADAEIAEDELISLIVSGRAPQDGVPMPAVKNMPLDQAVELLLETGFTNCFVYEQDSDAAAGIVFSQSLIEGAQTLYSDEVALFVSRYEEKAYSGLFSQTITLPDTASKVRVVLADYLNGVQIHFVVGEASDQTLTYHINLLLSAFSAGKKTVIVYVNNVQSYTYEVDFS